MEFCSNGWRACGYALLLLVVFGMPWRASAQTDEIQVYDGEIAPQGIFNLTIHNNFTPIGRGAPDYPGAIIPDHSWNGALEWAYGVTPWFEQGLYLPVWTPYSKDRGGSIDGFKIRELFARPNAAEHEFVYGVNFEFSFNYYYWEPRTFTSEVRPILGWHLHPFDIIINPIVDTDYYGGFGNLEFVPASRVAYNFNDRWAIAAEQYSDFGPLHSFLPARNQFQEVWAVLDHNGKTLSYETGVGFGVTPGADKLTLKLMVWRDLNSKPIRLFH